MEMPADRFLHSILLVLMKASLFVTRPTLVHYAASRDEVRSRTQDLFGWLKVRRTEVEDRLRVPTCRCGEGANRT